MSDLDRILKLAGRDAQEQAQGLTNEREMKAEEVCENCGCDLAKPAAGCECSHNETNEAVGDAAEVFYRMQDEFAGGEAEGAHKVLIDDLVRYLSGDQLEDFVADFKRHYDMNDMEESKSEVSDEEKEKAMRRAMHSADEPERGEKRKKVSLSKAPWESLEEDDLDENAFNQAAAAAARAGKSEFEFNGKKYKTKMDKSTAHQLDDDVQFESEDTFVGINTKSGDFESGLSYKEVTNGRFTHMLPDDTTYFDPDTAEELVGAPDEEMEAMGWEKVSQSEDTFVGINTETGDFESGLSYEEVTSGRFTHMLPDDTTYFDPDTAEELVGAPDEEMKAMGWKKVSLSEAPTMDTTQMITLMRNAGLSEDKIDKKINEWANSAAGAADEESTSYGEPYENFAQSVNLSLKRYLDAENMKVQVSEHKVEDMKALYESKKSK